MKKMLLALLVVPALAWGQTFRPLGIRTTTGELDGYTPGSVSNWTNVLEDAPHNTNRYVRSNDTWVVFMPGGGSGTEFDPIFTNWLTTNGMATTNYVNDMTDPQSGIWVQNQVFDTNGVCTGVRMKLLVDLLGYTVEPAAGLWRFHSDGRLHVFMNSGWNDRWWETNASGRLKLRRFP